MIEESVTIDVSASAAGVRIQLGDERVTTLILSGAQAADMADMLRKAIRAHRVMSGEDMEQ